jgi:hypothetical protein
VRARQRNPEKRAGLLRGKHTHFSILLAWQLNALRWITDEQLPTHCLA